MKKNKDVNAAIRSGFARVRSALFAALSWPFRGGPRALWQAFVERRRARSPADSSFTFRARAYSGSRDRRYLVHLPNGNTPTRPLPLVVVLHGCRQDHHDIKSISGFSDMADRKDFIVAYPFVTSYRGLRNRNCWGWWFEREIHGGAGEVEDLWQIIEEIRGRFWVDQRRIHVAGLSSGAGMAVALMVAKAEHIASGAAVAGVAYAETAQAVVHGFNPIPRYRAIDAIVADMRAELGPVTRTVPIQIVHSNDDDKVPVEAAHGLRDSWGQCFDVDTARPNRTRQGSTRGCDWQLARYRGKSRRSEIETLFLDGPGHGWYGGHPGEFSFPEAPDISRSIWRFFAAHPHGE